MPRIQSVDLMRLIAIFGVIIIHTTPFDSASHDSFYYLKIISNQLSKFAVPFFFTISGYFFYCKSDSGNLHEATLNTIKRLSLLYFFWCLFYLVPWNGSQFLVDFNSRFQNNPYNTVFEGTQIHLWFLVSLITSVFISYLFMMFNHKYSLYLLFTVSLLLFLFGVVAGSWSKTPIGIDINFNTRNGPFFGTLFFVTGMLLSKVQGKSNFLKVGGWLLFMGAFLQILESYFLYKKFNIFFTSSDYVFSTYIFALGFSLVSLSGWSKLNSKFSTLGKYVLGVYALHFSLVSMMSNFDVLVNNLLWELGYPIGVLITSLFICFYLSKIKIMRQFLT
jgi:surface polysaccharide O-acyltransferase-like enzyme